MLSDAIAFAAEAHEGQTRKDSGLPYVTHPVEVMVLLIRHGVRDEAILSAAVLHDVVEDCGISVAEMTERFGATVTEIVTALSKVPGLPDAERKRLALEQVRNGPPGTKTVKMADRLSNLLDMERISGSTEKKAAYLREADEIATIGQAELPALAAELRRVAAGQRARLAAG
jgi:guanosine-3',5'-bis(diphosphate) 3'-pyrophosphohydrolase